LLATVTRLLSVASSLPLLVAILSALTVPTLLSVAALLPVLRTRLPAVTTTRRGHRFKLAAQALHLAERRRLITLPRAALAGFALAYSLLCLPKLLT
jgi:hypothetical protein